MNTTTNSARSSRPSRNARKQLSAKASARPLAITIVAGSIINCTVAKIANQPESGLVVTIEGNPNGFIPNRLLAGKNPAAKEERRNHLLANPGTVLEAFVETAAMAAPKVSKSCTEATDNNERDSTPSAAKLRPRIILNEDKIVVGKIISARKESVARLQEQVAALAIGSTMTAKVLRFATKKNDNNDSTHVIGAFVELANGLPALLHKSQMLDINHISVGITIYVAINSAEMDGKRVMVKVKQLSPQAEIRPQADTPAPTGRSASQSMWDQVADTFNQSGSGPKFVIDPSV